MSKVAYFDCLSGASGDMVLGALVDAGVCFEELRERLHALRLDEFSLSAAKVTRGSIAATKVDVSVAHGGGHEQGSHGSDHEQGSLHHHRGLRDVLGIIDGSGLSQKVKNDATAVFRRLAEAEAKVHNTTPDKIHFHEVGAVDSIVDIVGAAAGLELLGADQILVSPIRTGTGFVTCQHGRLPVPAPATVELLERFPSVGTDVPHELTTPTGAAILTTLGSPARRRPAMEQYRVGYGAGGRDNPDMPNVLRLFVGQLAVDDTGDEVWVVETNLDDLSPEIVAHACERIFQAGALDVFTSPIGMKKGRQGILIQALAPPSRLEAVEDAIFAETTTLGVRRYKVQRSKLERTKETVSTAYGEIGIKVGRRAGRVVTAAPEYEDCRAAAEATGTPLKAVYEAAQAAFRT